MYDPDEIEYREQSSRNLVAEAKSSDTNNFF